MSEHYDVIIIGTGAGGGTLAHRLAPTGKRILLLERGGYLPREPENWDSLELFGKERYVTTETWYDKSGAPFRPHAQYFVGGNTKVYGAILFRFRERGFGEVRHYGGVSPAWPVTYADFEPYYTEAEKLYLVHGQECEDPTEPYRPRCAPCCTSWRWCSDGLGAAVSSGAVPRPRRGRRSSSPAASVRDWPGSPRKEALRMPAARRRPCPSPPRGRRRGPRTPGQGS
jgi:choline dehydrogenase-like flavoprotein